MQQSAREQAVRRSAELERNNEELKILNEVSLAISRTTDLGELLAELLRTLARIEVLPFAMQGAIFLVDGTTLRLASPGIFPEEFLAPRGTVPIDQCLCGITMIPGGVVAVGSAGEEGRPIVCNTALPPHSHVIIPLMADGRTVGLLCLYTPPDCTLSETMLELLGAIGGQIGVGVGNARLYEETKSSSLHDPLTGLANRRFMEIQLAKVFEIARRYGDHLSLIMMDIDHFKKYNDSRGHPEGDRLLAKVAAILAREMRQADYLFRYGGEEFLTILPHASLEMAVKAAGRLRRSVEAETGVTISLGVAAYEEGLSDPEMLIRKADEALYLAKRNGRNRVEIAVS